MNKLFERIFFKALSTPSLNASNMNAISKAVDDIDDRVIDLAVGINSISESVETAEKYASQIYHYTPEGYPDLVARADMVSNPNLLDNGWFTVNQRGQSSYSGNNSYTLDRWYVWSGGGNLTVTKNNQGITLKNDSDAQIRELIQYLDIDFSRHKSEKITLSLMLQNGTVISEVGTVPNTLDGQANYIIDKEVSGFGRLMLGVRTTRPFFDLRTTTPSAEISIKSAKLEWGSTSTLSADNAPNYAEELLKCQLSTADSTDEYANQVLNTDWNPTITDANQRFNGIKFNSNNSVSNCPTANGLLVSFCGSGSKNSRGYQYYLSYALGGGDGFYYRDLTNSTTTQWRRVARSDEVLKSSIFSNTNDSVWSATNTSGANASTAFPTTPGIYRTLGTTPAGFPEGASGYGILLRFNANGYTLCIYMSSEGNVFFSRIASANGIPSSWQKATVTYVAPKK